jgi:hypothetical protein
MEKWNMVAGRVEEKIISPGRWIGNKCFFFFGLKLIWTCSLKKSHLWTQKMTKISLFLIKCHQLFKCTQKLTQTGIAEDRIL